ncbi:hypothetical protein [Clostridium tetani]|uniref:hypothetical protein n=1 Tax=Clostridium tetani TaxID=1513 RepID=UPI0029553A24|nr:hypothetical protein [Clostridium tetani]BDR64541.1 hypothetical protein K134307016_14750 [Clostridium tetani]
MKDYMMCKCMKDCYMDSMCNDDKMDRPLCNMCGLTPLCPPNYIMPTAKDDKKDMDCKDMTDIRPMYMEQNTCDMYDDMDYCHCMHDCMHHCMNPGMDHCMHHDMNPGMDNCMHHGMNPGMDNCMHYDMNPGMHHDMHCCMPPYMHSEMMCHPMMMWGHGGMHPMMGGYPGMNPMMCGCDGMHPMMYSRELDFEEFDLDED